MKKSWVKPKLLVLARSTDPEDVLVLCKGGAVSGPDTNYVGCAANCANCSTEGQS